MIFDSVRFFQLWIYTVSHSTLILRSPNNENVKEAGYNIDIEFWGVTYLDLPDLFNGIKIRKMEDNIPQKFDKFKNGCEVFEISTDNNNHYIVASGCIVGKNNWINENRILNPYLEYDEIIAT
jgi:hypothetical protein